jgi:hypothetical protein
MNTGHYSLQRPTYWCYLGKQALTFVRIVRHEVCGQNADMQICLHDGMCYLQLTMGCKL